MDQKPAAGIPNPVGYARVSTRDQESASQERRADATAEFADVVRQAHGVVPIATSAGLGGISRPTIYKMVADGESHDV